MFLEREDQLFRRKLERTEATERVVAVELLFFVFLSEGVSFFVGAVVLTAGTA